MVELNRNDKETIGTTNIVVSKDKLNSKSIRKNIIITNTSSAGQIITLAIDSPATSGEGLVLNPGGSWSDSAESGYTPTQRAINAISSAAGGQVSIQERLIQ